MAVDMFLKIDGVDGEAKDNSHEKEIEVLAWSWGMSQSGSMHVGAGGGAGKVNVQDMSITKYVDKSTPNLMAACATGKHYSEIKLTVRKAGESPLEYVKITMSRVIVTSVSTGGSGGEDRLTENTAFNFAEYKIEYTPQKDDGSGDAVVESAFNIEKNITA